MEEAGLSLLQLLPLLPPSLPLPSSPPFLPPSLLPLSPLLFSFLPWRVKTGSPPRCAFGKPVSDSCPEDSRDLEDPDVAFGGRVWWLGPGGWWLGWGTGVNGRASGEILGACVPKDSGKAKGEESRSWVAAGLLVALTRPEDDGWRWPFLRGLAGAGGGGGRCSEAVRLSPPPGDGFGITKVLRARLHHACD